MLAEDEVERGDQFEFDPGVSFDEEAAAAAA